MITHMYPLILYSQSNFAVCIQEWIIALLFINEWIQLSAVKMLLITDAYMIRMMTFIDPGCWGMGTYTRKRLISSSSTLILYVCTCAGQCFATEIFMLKSLQKKKTGIRMESGMGGDGKR